MFSKRHVLQAGWVGGSFAAVQVMRLASNVVLARLLAPQLFGIMQIVNSLRTGVELLSEIGVSQNIVQNKDGEKPNFYHTAWTLQIIRGVLLFLVFLAAAPLAANFFGQDELARIMPAVATVFLISGASYPAFPLLQRRQEVSKLAKYQFFGTACSVLLQVGIAWHWPTIWALVVGLLAFPLIILVCSFFAIKTEGRELILDRVYLRQILSMGKWLFLSTLFYFFATNFDRLYFAKELSIATLGIYGIARTFSGAFTQLFERIAKLLVFPKIAAFKRDRSRMRDSILPVRRLALFLIACGLALSTSLSDQVIVLLYDERYLYGAVILPILLVGVWFSVLSTTSEAVMLGIGQPRHAAMANLVKMIWLVLSVPLALAKLDIVAAFCAIALADMVRYLWLSLAQAAEGLSFKRQDIALTALLIVMIVGWRLGFESLGIVPEFRDWLAYAESSHG